MGLPERLRHCRENYSLRPGEPKNRETKNRRCRSRGEPQESRIQFHGGFENPNPQNLGVLETVGNEKLSRKQKERAPEELSSVFQN